MAIFWQILDILIGNFPSINIAKSFSIQGCQPFHKIHNRSVFWNEKSRSVLIQYGTLFFLCFTNLETNKMTQTKISIECSRKFAKQLSLTTGMTARHKTFSNPILVPINNRIARKNVCKSTDQTILRRCSCETLHAYTVLLVLTCIQNSQMELIMITVMLSVIQGCQPFIKIWNRSVFRNEKY